MAQFCRRKVLCNMPSYRHILGGKAHLSSSHLTTSSSSFARNSFFEALLRPSVLVSPACLEQCVLVRIFSRRNTNAAYPPPTPPEEFSSADVPDGEGDGAEGAELNMPDNANAMPDLNENMYDEGNEGDEEDEVYEEEEPAPDPEAEALYSPAEDD